MGRDSNPCAEGTPGDTGTGLFYGGTIGLLVGLLTGQAAMVALIGAGVGLIFGLDGAEDREG